MDLFNQYVALVDGVKLTILIVLIFVDLLLGIIAAIKDKTFQFSKLGDFLNTTVLTMVGGYFVVGGVALVHPEFNGLVTASWGILDLTLLGGIWIKLGKLGLPVPKIM